MLHFIYVSFKENKILIYKKDGGLAKHIVLCYKNY